MTINLCKAVLDLIVSMFHSYNHIFVLDEVALHRSATLQSTLCNYECSNGKSEYQNQTNNPENTTNAELTSFQRYFAIKHARAQ